MDMKSSELQKDGLTGLCIRKCFHDEFQNCLAQAQASDEPLAIALLDIDRFKTLNDHFGHGAGDQVITEIARLIEQLAGPDTLAGRIGGDEFAILFKGTEREQALLVMERIRLEVQNLQVTVDRQVIGGISVSAGIAAFPIDGRTHSELVRKADQALYRAKVGGRDRVRLAFEEKMVPKTSHFPQTQLERLSRLAAEHKVGEAELLREALDDLLVKYGVDEIES
jgi:diguanylate cyclase (GGDEF)-like protein